MPTYNVDDFEDEELFSLLELPSNPSDGVLEARIIQMLQRHMYLRTESGRQLFQFFMDPRFFAHTCRIEYFDRRAQPIGAHRYGIAGDPGLWPCQQAVKSQDFVD